MLIFDTFKAVKEILSIGPGPESLKRSSKLHGYMFVQVETS